MYISMRLFVVNGYTRIFDDSSMFRYRTNEDIRNLFKNSDSSIKNTSIPCLKKSLRLETSSSRALSGVLSTSFKSKILYELLWDYRG